MAQVGIKCGPRVRGNAPSQGLDGAGEGLGIEHAALAAAKT